MAAKSAKIVQLSALREKAKKIIDDLEMGHCSSQEHIQEINEGSRHMVEIVKNSASFFLEKGKIVGVLGRRSFYVSWIDKCNF